MWSLEKTRREFLALPTQRRLHVLSQAGKEQYVKKGRKIDIEGLFGECERNPVTHAKIAAQIIRITGVVS